MKRFIVLIAAFSVVFMSANVLAEKKVKCATVKDGVLLDSAGDLITAGFDDWGYNYQARSFNGFYCDAYRDAAWCQLWTEDRLSMKWNAAWLDNKDCDDDGKLDRHHGFTSYIGSGAWLTNHMSGEYLDDGNMCSWVYFTKIVAAPADAYKDSGVWFTANGDEIGPVIWGQFATIQTVSNDACSGEQGLQYKSPVGPGFGKY